MSADRNDGGNWSAESVVALPIFDVKGTSSDRSVSLTDTRCLYIGRSDLQHIRPIQRDNVGMGIVCGKHNSEDTVTGGDFKNLERCIGIGIDTLDEQLGWQGHERHHATCKVHPDRVFGRYRALLRQDSSPLCVKRLRRL